jgi:hypothetical protein
VAAQQQHSSSARAAAAVVAVALVAALAMVSAEQWQQWGIDGDSGGNIGVSGGGEKGGRCWQWQRRPKQGQLAKVVADNNRNCGGRQQSTKCGRRHQ